MYHHGIDIYRVLFGGLEQFLFSHILRTIIPIDYIIFCRGVQTTNQTIINIQVCSALTYQKYTFFYTISNNVSDIELLYKLSLFIYTKFGITIISIFFTIYTFYTVLTYLERQLENHSKL